MSAFIWFQKKNYTLVGSTIITTCVCARDLVQTFLSNGPSSLVSPSEAY